MLASYEARMVGIHMRWNGWELPDVLPLGYGTVFEFDANGPLLFSPADRSTSSSLIGIISSPLIKKKVTSAAQQEVFLLSLPAHQSVLRKKTYPSYSSRTRATASYVSLKVGTFQLDGVLCPPIIAQSNGHFVSLDNPFCRLNSLSTLLDSLPKPFTLVQSAPNEAQVQILFSEKFKICGGDN